MIIKLERNCFPAALLRTLDIQGGSPVDITIWYDGSDQHWNSWEAAGSTIRHHLQPQEVNQKIDTSRRIDYLSNMQTVSIATCFFAYRHSLLTDDDDGNFIYYSSFWESW